MWKRVGKDVVIYPQAKIVFEDEISIGNNVIIDDFVLMLGKGRITIGDFVHISHFSSLTGGAGITLEDFVTISAGVRLCSGNDDYSGGWMSNSTIPAKYRGDTRKPIVIKKHAIVGANSVVLPGVTIGEGVAIGANSLVNRDCDPWMIYGGTPAKPIKPRIRNIIPELEKELRAEIYDQNGNYIPKEMWR